jgi:mono/diheme cytochrome c family protein
MASFADVLDVADAEAIHAYVLARAHQSPTWLQRVAGFAAQHVCVPISLVTD